MTSSQSISAKGVPVERCSERGCFRQAAAAGGRCRLCMALAGDTTAWLFFRRMTEVWPDNDGDGATVTVQQAAEVLGWRIERVYALVWSGQLASVGENGDVRIPAGELREYLENRPAVIRGACPGRGTVPAPGT